MYCNNHMLCLGDCPKTFKSISDERLSYLFSYTQGRIYYEANEASASGPHHLGGPHQNFNTVSKVDFYIA